ECHVRCFFFFFQAEDGIRDFHVTGVQTCALPILNNADLILSFRKGADASDGRVVLTSGSNYGPARASGNFYLGGPRLRLSDVDVNAGGVTAQGDVALSNNFPSSADLTFTARQGAFLASGDRKST